MMSFDVALTAINQAARLGLGTDADEITSLLGQFARRAALVTHPKGNRRYGGYVLRVEGPRVYSVAEYAPGEWVCPDCHGTGKHHQYDEGRWIDVPCQNPECSEETRTHG